MKEIRFSKESRKICDLIGKTLLVVFVFVNSFNFIPISFFNPAWGNNISMSFIDTGVILFLSLLSLKISLLIQENIYEVSENKAEETNILKLQKLNFNSSVFEKLIMISKSCYVILILLQIYIIFNGLNIIERQFQNNVKSLETRLEILTNRVDKNELDKSELENILGESYRDLKDNKTAEDSIDIETEKLKNNLINFKESSIKFSAKAINQNKFILIKDRFKIVLLSVLFIYSFSRINNILI